MSSKQYFSTDSMMSYDEYLKFRSGSEEIKNRLSRDDNSNIKYFIDYRSFLTLTMAFYKQINNRSEVSAPLSLANATTSYKCYELFQNHIENCKYCSTCTNISHIFYCKEIQNILYPYGNAVVKKDNLNNMRYPSTLQLSKYCNKCNSENCCCEKPYYPPCYPPCYSPCYLPCPLPCVPCYSPCPPPRPPCPLPCPPCYSPCPPPRPPCPLPCPPYYSPCPPPRPPCHSPCPPPRPPCHSRCRQPFYSRSSCNCKH